jgi:hypothetical protein
MFQDAMDLTDSGLFELRRRLEAYANTRLSPSTLATARMRANVMNAAHRRAALIAAGGTIDTAAASTAARVVERSRSATTTWRRAAAALVAAGLTVAMVAGTAYAAKPGGLLYDTRIWIEMANLPADVVARAEAEISRLDARLEEAQQASTEGDVPAAEAALSAYSVILVEAAQGSAGDPTAGAAIEIALSRHVVVLTALADSVPAPARAAVQQALASSTKVLNDLDGASVQDSRGSAVGNGASRSTRADGPKSTGPTKFDTTTPAGVTPEKSQKPDKDAAPDVAGPEDAQESPHPGQVRPGGTDKGPASRPSHAPTIPERRPAGPPKPGET